MEEATEIIGLGQWLFDSMKKHGDKILLYDSDNDIAITFSDVLSQSIRTALYLKKKGISRNDVISICSHNQKYSCVPFFATQFLGAKSATFDPTLSHLDTVHLLKLVQPKIIFVSEEALDFMEKCAKSAGVDTEFVIFGSGQFSKFLVPNKDEPFFVPVKISNEKDTAVIVFSSGTTGFPKGICLSHLSLKHCGRDFFLYSLTTKNPTVSLTFATLYWISAILNLFTCVTNGYATVLCKEFEPARVWKLIEKYKDIKWMYQHNRTNYYPLNVDDKNFNLINLISSQEFLPYSFVINHNDRTLGLGFCNIDSSIHDLSDSLLVPIDSHHPAIEFYVTFTFLAPYNATACLEKKPKNIDVSSTEVVITGSCPVNERLMNGLIEAFPNAKIFHIYGQTELSQTVIFFDPLSEDESYMQIIKPLSCGKVRRELQWKIVDVNSEKVLGPRQEGELRIKSKYAMNGYYKMDSSLAFDSEGFLKTGDLAYYDEDKCMYIVGRIKEMFKYRGWHVLPEIIENIIKLHPAVKEAAVVGLPHEIDGDHPMAAVVLFDEYADTDKNEILNFVNERVADHQKLRGGIEFLKSLPKTATSKIKRAEVKNIILQKISQYF